MNKKYTAGELARWAGVSARTIRFYEEKGILQQGENLSVSELLTRQRELVLEERNRLDRILAVISQAERHCQDGQLPVSRFVEIMQLVTRNQQADFRYGLYERYATNRQRWHEWLFDRLPLKPGMHVLDVGCGHGNVRRQSMT